MTTLQHFQAYRTVRPPLWRLVLRVAWLKLIGPELRAGPLPWWRSRLFALKCLGLGLLGAAVQVVPGYETFQAVLVLAAVAAGFTIGLLNSWLSPWSPKSSPGFWAWLRRRGLSFVGWAATGTVT